MDQSRLSRLIKEIEAQGGMGDFTGPTPMVSLELFFEGNDDRGSIGCNLAEDEFPGFDTFYRILKDIRSRSDVQDVLVKISDVDTDGWPFSEQVFILTSTAKEEVENWVKRLCPSEIFAVDELEADRQWEKIKSPKAPSLSTGMRAIGLWWD